MIQVVVHVSTVGKFARRTCRADDDEAGRDRRQLPDPETQGEQRDGMYRWEWVTVVAANQEDGEEMDQV